MGTKLNETSEFTKPRKNLISLIVPAGFSVWVYFGIEARITMLENKTTMHQVAIQTNYDWTKGWVPPPAVAIAVERVRELELKVKKLETLSNIEWE